MLSNALKNEYKFKDFSHFEEMISLTGHIEHSQMDCGIFSGELTQIICGPVIIHWHRMNRKILQNGNGISGFTTFLLIDNLEEDLYWRKKKLNGNTLGILRPNMEHNCITPVNFSAISITIENAYLEKFVLLFGYEQFFRAIKTKETLVIDIEKAQKIRQLVTSLCKYEIIDAKIVSSHLTKLIIEAILSSHSDGSYKVGLSRGKIFEQAKEIIHNNFENPISVPSLVKELGTSERNLRYSFKQHAGISPKKYINYYRLNRARKLIAGGKIEKIVDASHEIGFWHTGKFAADYRRLFGEYPSQTKQSATSSYHKF